MNEKEKTVKIIASDSELMKAVKLLEENGFYVVHADTGWNRKQGECPPFYPSALLIQAIPKHLVSIYYRHDIIVDGKEVGSGTV
ncbi:MAG: hypothetical protein LBV17_08620 [Treponema sp.]|jgi:hypothetical protein|nr:hypothetical protein [Treponema sp.]